MQGKKVVMRAEAAAAEDAVLIAQTHDIIIVRGKEYLLRRNHHKFTTRVIGFIIRPAYSLRFRWRRSISPGRHVRYRLLSLRLHVFGALFVPEVGENAEQTQRGDIDDAGERGDF